jgi:hypothetical protein
MLGGRVRSRFTSWDAWRNRTPDSSQCDAAAGSLLMRDDRWSLRDGRVACASRTRICHACDVTGAIRAGCAAAFLACPTMVLDTAGEQPDVIGCDVAPGR